MSDAAEHNRPMTITRLAKAMKHLQKMHGWRNRLIEEMEVPTHPKHHLVEVTRSERDAIEVAYELCAELREAMHDKRGTPWTRKYLTGEPIKRRLDQNPVPVPPAA